MTRRRPDPLEIDLEELQGEMSKLRRGATCLDENLENAESCETVEDFFANVDNALDDAKTLVGELNALAARRPLPSVGT